jgi:hypothetical protein
VLFFVTGASGAGKSTLIPYLRDLLPDFVVADFDHHPIQETIGFMATPEQRQQVAEAWVQDALDAAPRHTIICGLGVMGEVLACPSAVRLDHVAFCLLDCADVERMDRLKRRGDGLQQSMDILCWSAWLRVHHVDPQFRPDVINTGKNSAMVWSRWSGWQRSHPHWRCCMVDTTHLAPSEVAGEVVAWVRREQALVASGYRILLDE